MRCAVCGAAVQHFCTPLGRRLQTAVCSLHTWKCAVLHTAPVPTPHRVPSGCRTPATHAGAPIGGTSEPTPKLPTTDPSRKFSGCSAHSGQGVSRHFRSEGVRRNRARLRRPRQPRFGQNEAAWPYWEGSGIFFGFGLHRPHTTGGLHIDHHRPTPESNSRSPQSPLRKIPKPGKSPIFGRFEGFAVTKTPKTRKKSVRGSRPIFRNFQISHPPRNNEFPGSPACAFCPYVIGYPPKMPIIPHPSGRPRDFEVPSQNLGWSRDPRVS